MARVASIILCCLACLSCVHTLDNANSTGTHATSAVFLDNESSFGVCVYPTSVRIEAEFDGERAPRRIRKKADNAKGTYGFLARLLYYCALVFSLFSRAHLWLVAGALAAALTYSGGAAIHACLLVWRGPNPFIENDSWVLYTILNAACLITVPLLNWSGTLRRLGQKAASMKDRKALETNSDVGTRTIVIYWAFLILIGYICIWQQTRYGSHDDNSEYPDMTKVMCRSGTNASLFMESNGTFYRRAIDAPFIQDNGCTDPCNLVNIPSIFRNQNELVLLKHSEALLWNYTLPGPKYQKAERLMTTENEAFSINFYSLPFILVQGFIVALFGRRDPREIRDVIYINLFMEHHISSRPILMTFQEGFVRALAALNYLIACAVVIFCAPLFVISIVAQELQIWTQQPESESPYQIGQWSVWAYTALVILAALIARYHNKLVSGIARAFRAGRTHDPDHEHGVAEITEKKPGNPTTPSRSLAGTSSITAPPSAPSSSAPLRDGKPKPTASQRALETFISFSKNCCHPLNQSGKGPIDELQNFFRWCQNPQEVSTPVIRHPIRQQDTRFIDAPPAIVDAHKGDPRAKENERSFWKGASGSVGHEV